MAHGIFQSLRGKEGRVVIPGVGAVVGIIGDWSLTRREDSGPAEGTYDLRASFSYLNVSLFNAKMKKRVEISLSKDNQFSLDQLDGMRTVLIEKRLLMEGVTLCPLRKA
jgi:hypothetical protein